MTSPSHKIRPDDFSEARMLPVDPGGVRKQFRNLQEDVYGYINEFLYLHADREELRKENKRLTKEIDGLKK